MKSRFGSGFSGMENLAAQPRIARRNAWKNFPPEDTKMARPFRKLLQIPLQIHCKSKANASITFCQKPPCTDAFCKLRFIPYKTKFSGAPLVLPERKRAKILRKSAHHPHMRKTLFQCASPPHRRAAPPPRRRAKGAFNGYAIPALAAASSQARFVRTQKTGVQKQASDKA